MAEREADRISADRMRRQAVAVFTSDAAREVSLEFRRRLREHDAAPTLFDSRELIAAARSGLETDIASNIEFSPSANSLTAVGDAFRQRGAAYALEVKCQLISERHPAATIVSESIKKACDDGASEAAVLVMVGRPFSNANDPVRLTDNLLLAAQAGGQ